MKTTKLTKLAEALDALHDLDCSRHWHEDDDDNWDEKVDGVAYREKQEELASNVAHLLMEAVTEYHPVCGQSDCDWTELPGRDLVMQKLFQLASLHLVDQANLGAKYPKKHHMISDVMSIGYPKREVVLGQLGLMEVQS